jgi:acylphosphatase
VALPEGHKAVRVSISGCVQGVWFRGWTVDQARSRSLDGWVRNRADGTVEAIFVGPVDLVDEMVAACHEGPPAADVVEVTVTPAMGLVVSGFHQKPSI